VSAYHGLWYSTRTGTVVRTLQSCSDRLGPENVFYTYEFEGVRHSVCEACHDSGQVFDNTPIFIRTQYEQQHVHGQHEHLTARIAILEEERKRRADEISVCQATKIHLAVRDNALQFQLNEHLGQQHKAMLYKRRKAQATSKHMPSSEQPAASFMDLDLDRNTLSNIVLMCNKLKSDVDAVEQRDLLNQVNKSDLNMVVRTDTFPGTTWTSLCYSRQFPCICFEACSCLSRTSFLVCCRMHPHIYIVF